MIASIFDHIHCRVSCNSLDLEYSVWDKMNQSSEMTMTRTLALPKCDINNNSQREDTSFLHPQLFTQTFISASPSDL